MNKINTDPLKFSTALGRSRQASDAVMRAAVGQEIELEWVHQTAQDQRAAIGCREVDIEHLDGSELVAQGPRGEARRPWLECSGYSQAKWHRGKCHAPFLSEIFCHRRAARSRHSGQGRKGAGMYAAAGFTRRIMRASPGEGRRTLEFYCERLSLCCAEDNCREHTTPPT